MPLKGITNSIDISTAVNLSKNTKKKKKNVKDIPIYLTLLPRESYLDCIST